MMKIPDTNLLINKKHVCAESEGFTFSDFSNLLPVLHGQLMILDNFPKETGLELKPYLAINNWEIILHHEMPSVEFPNQCGSETEAAYEFAASYHALNPDSGLSSYHPFSSSEYYESLE
ncbi:oxygen-dependent choline dehydrogenase [Striga asiatica]|uniref:Oxygen-dependent choline dehydrogenase n=1 Tax=Striga asiatica TaxID=4170 RepID=A0A5A7P5X8_STRAF|nr:oxygen-dependent choline dehydrogenase [Striga asiatica]